MIVFATVYWKPSETWQSLIGIVQLFAQSAVDTGATGSTAPNWAFLPIKMATALPWLLVGMTASVVLVGRLSGDVRRIGRSDRLRDAIVLATALGVAAAAAQLIQSSVVDACREQGLTREDLPSLGLVLTLVLTDGLAEFACGAVIGCMVPYAFRANLVTPSDRTMVRALRNLLRDAWTALGSKAAGEDWVFTPNDEEIAWAQEVVAAFDSAGGAALQLPSGEFVDVPVADRAKRVLELAARLRKPRS